jgi:penicillin amidase
VADLADLNRCWDVVAIGASGQPLSPHYADQMDLWLNGDYKAMYFDRAEIEALPNVKLTVLTPGGWEQAAV